MKNKTWNSPNNVMYITTSAYYETSTLVGNMETVKRQMRS